MRRRGFGSVVIRSGSPPPSLLFAIFLLLQGLPSAAGAAPLAQSLALSADGDFIILAELEGRPVRLRVDPASGGILLNLRYRPETGNQRIRPARSMRWWGRFGSMAGQGRGRLAIGAWRGRRPVRWFDRDIVPEADGLIGLNELPYRMTTLHLRPARARPARADVRGRAQRILRPRLSSAPCRGDARFRLRASPARDACHGGGRCAPGNAFQRRMAGRCLPGARHYISVLRPLRRMQFANPIAIGDLRLGAMLVRTADFRGAFVLPEDASSDPSEIVVTGRQRAQPGPLDGGVRLRSIEPLQQHPI